MEVVHRGDTSSLVDKLTAATVLLSSAWLFCSPLRATGDILAYAEDDFYYYLVVARNLAKGLGSTFDGTTLTNGYHPLYLVLFWIVCKFVGSLRGIYTFLALLDTMSAVAIFLATRAYLRRHLRSVWLTNGFALLILGFCIRTISYQMEVTLTLPLGFWFLYLVDHPPANLSEKSTLLIGFVASLLILSRLDAALLVALCGLLAVSMSSYRSQMTSRKVLALMAGISPLLLLYLVTNELFFHRLTPISGAAKQLKVAFSLNFPPRFYDKPVTEALFTLSVMTLIFTGLRWKRMMPAERLIYTAAAAFPFVHWGLNLSLSDWQVWPWYSYSLRFVLICFCGTVGALIESQAVARTRRYLEPGLFALALLILLHKHYWVSHVMVDIAAASRGISAFAQTHPGLYAMGDRAGMVGYLNGQPTLQTEGLMMDNTYLEHIKRQEPLIDVLKLNRVDYYIAFNERRGGERWNPVVGCFKAKEPAQAGPKSDTMQGSFCDVPLWSLIQPTGQTLIFALRPHGGS